MIRLLTASLAAATLTGGVVSAVALQASGPSSDQASWTCVNKVVATVVGNNLPSPPAVCVGPNKPSNDKTQVVASWTCASKLVAKVVGHSVPAVENLHACVGPVS
jgi:hypothetical protein